MTSPFASRTKPHRLGESESRRLSARVRATDTSPNPSAPRLVGDGPVEFSTSFAVDYTPRFVWDTNGFYRAFGLTPEVSRADIRRAVAHRFGLAGGRDEWTATAAKVLLSKTLRRKYDATPLGSFWANDPHLPAVTEDGEPAMEVVEGWPWAYYVLGLDEDAIDEVSLASWRAYISYCMHHRGAAPANYALGVCPGDVVAVGQVGYRTVIFVGIAIKASWEYASDVAASLSTTQNPASP